MNIETAVIIMDNYAAQAKKYNWSEEAAFREDGQLRVKKNLLDRKLMNPPPRDNRRRRRSARGQCGRAA